MAASANIWLTGQEAAAYLGRSDEWLRRKVNAGKVRFSINPSNGRKVYNKAILDRIVKPVTPEQYLGIK